MIGRLKHKLNLFCSLHYPSLFQDLPFTTSLFSKTPPSSKTTFFKDSPFPRPSLRPRHLLPRSLLHDPPFHDPPFPMLPFPRRARPGLISSRVSPTAHFFIETIKSSCCCQLSQFITLSWSDMSFTFIWRTDTGEYVNHYGWPYDSFNSYLWLVYSPPFYINRCCRFSNKYSS